MTKNIIFIFMMFVLFSTCDFNKLDIDNIKLPNNKGTYVFPISRDTFSVREIIEDIEDMGVGREEDENGLFTLTYRDTLEYSSIDDFVDIEDIEVSDDIEDGVLPKSNSDLINPPRDTLLDFEQIFTFSYENEDGNTESLEEIVHSEGMLRVNILTNIQSDLEYTAIFNNTTSPEGEKLQITGDILGEDDGGDEERDISDHATTFSRGSNGENQFTVRFFGTINLQVGESFLGIETLSFEVSFRDQRFKSILGSLGRDTIEIDPQKVDAGFFSDLGEGFFFQKPTINFRFTNSYGVPFAVDFSNLSVADSTDEGEENILGYLSGNVVDSPPIVMGIDPNVKTGAAESIFEINRSNSNLGNLLAETPSHINFGLTVIANSQDENELNFISTDSKMEAIMEMNIPFSVKLEDVEQVFAYDLGEGLSDIDLLDAAYLRIFTINQFPFGGTLELNIKDSLGNVTYSAPKVASLTIPFIDQEGKATEAIEKVSDLVLTSEGIIALKSASEIELKTVFNSPRTQNSREIFVDLLADYQLIVSLAIGVTLDTEL